MYSTSRLGMMLELGLLLLLLLLLVLLPVDGCEDGDGSVEAMLWVFTSWADIVPVN